MPSILNRATQQGLINPPTWLCSNLQWEVIYGSEAYGTSSGSSDMDIYGWAIPHKDVIFPHLGGIILGFDDYQPFQQYQQHHVMDKGARRQYDFTVYGVVRYFELCAQNNPNMIDSLFVPRRCILHSTEVGEMVRNKRHKFLHKGSWYKYRGYSFAQMSKIRGKTASKNEKRADLIEQHGYDTKFGMHVVRLLLQIEEIMTTGDLHLDRNVKILKAVRNGEWSFEQLDAWFKDKEKSLESCFAESKLQAYPPMDELKTLLLEVLEHHYGSLDNVIKRDKSIESLVRDIEGVLVKYVQH